VSPCEAHGKITFDALVVVLQQQQQQRRRKKKKDTPALPAASADDIFLSL